MREVLLKIGQLPLYKQSLISIYIKNLKQTKQFSMLKTLVNAMLAAIPVLSLSLEPMCSD